MSASPSVFRESEVSKRHATPESREPRPERRWINWPSLIDQVPRDRIWYQPGWLTRGPTLCSGPGGIGKTLLLQQLLTHLAVGRSYLDSVPAPATSLLWACEDDHDELWRRQRDICGHLGIGLESLDGKLTIDARLGLDNTLFGVAFGRPTWTPLSDGGTGAMAYADAVAVYLAFAVDRMAQGDDRDPAEVRR